MKNKFLAILLSAILLVTMVPFAFASSADSAAEGIVQGANDAVVIMHGNMGSGFATFYNHFTNNKIDNAGSAYDRIIFVFANDYTYKLTASGHLGQSGITGTESFVFTSKCTVTDPDKTFEATNGVISPYTGSAGLHNYFDNEDASQNAQFAAGDANDGARFLIFHCKTEWDYLTFKQLGKNFLFYLCYHDTTFGAHYKNVPAGNGTSFTQYPCIVNGRANPNATAEATFSGTQTINVLGASWAYVLTGGRDANVINEGTINLNLKNATFKAEVNVNTGSPNSVVMMGRDQYTANARINVTVEGCNFKQFALFSATTTGGTLRTNAGSLSVTLNGFNSFDRGIENLRYNQDFADVFIGTPSLTLNINGPIYLGVGKTIDGLDNTTLNSTVNYNGVYASAASLHNFDNMTDNADYSGYSTDENGAIVYVNTNIPQAECGMGKTAAEPVRTIDQAFSALSGIGTGGTIILAKEVWTPDAELPELNGNVIITSDVSDSLLILLGVLEFHNNVTFKNVNFGKTGSNKVFFMNDNDLTFENCGFYENAGGTALGNAPVKGAHSTESTLVVATAPRVKPANDAIKDNRVIDQTITVSGNADGFTLLRIAAGYKASQDQATTYIAEDTSSGCTGEVNVIVGENAAVKMIDAVSENNSYDVNITLPGEQLGDVELRSTNDAGTASTVIYTTKAATVQNWLKADMDYALMGASGYSLRAKNTAGKFAMRAGYTAPAANLDAAVEYGVLVKRSANPNALTWFDNGYAPGITALPAAQTYNNGVGKSVVYLNPILDNADKTTLAADARYLFTCPVVFSTLNATTAAYQYDFLPYAVYGIQVDGAAGYYYAYGTGADQITASLNDMIAAVTAAGDAQGIAAAISAEING